MDISMQKERGLKYATEAKVLLKSEKVTVNNTVRITSLHTKSK